MSEPLVAGSRLAFVGGLHRSGTSALTRVLAEHPDVSALAGTGAKEDEGQHVQNVYPPARAHGGPGRFASREAHLTEASPLVSDTSAQTLIRSWTPYWDTSRQLLVEKSPPNLIRGRFLQELFPGSSLVVVIRHPVVVALSTAKWRRLASRRWWRYTSLHGIVDHWFRAHQMLREDAGHLGRLHVVKYEELLSDPAGELSRLQRFLGLETPLRSSAFAPGHTERYQARWEQMQRRWPARSIRARIEGDFEASAATFGYDIRDVATMRPWRL